MPTVRLPIGTRRQSLLFMFIDFLIYIFRNPEYKLHRRIIILSIFVFGYLLLIFPYQTMTIGLIGIAVYLLQIIHTDLKNTFVIISDVDKLIINKYKHEYDKGKIYIYERDEETYDYKLNRVSTYNANIKDNLD